MAWFGVWSESAGGPAGEQLGNKPGRAQARCVPDEDWAMLWDTKTSTPALSALGAYLARLLRFVAPCLFAGRFLRFFDGRGGRLVFGREAVILLLSLRVGAS